MVIGEMSVIAGTVYVKSANKLFDVRPTDLQDFSIQLNDKTSYMVGIDQSTTCTGIAVVDTKFNFYIIFDLKRENEEKTVYLRNLKYFLGRLFNGVEVSMIIHEEPVPSNYAPTSHSVLTELRGKLREWISEIPALNKAELHSMYPQTWKTNIVTKEYAEKIGVPVKKIFNSKAKMADRICDLYPFFRPYRNKHFSIDYDAFDAVGILMGWLRYSRDDKGRPRICGIREKRHVSMVCYAYITLEELKRYGCYANLLGNVKWEIEPLLLMYNTNYTKHENIRMASSNWDAVVTVLPNSQISATCWKFGLEQDNRKIMLMYVFRKGKYKKSVIEEIKYALPNNEEVYDS